MPLPTFNIRRGGGFSAVLEGTLLIRVVLLIIAPLLIKVAVTCSVRVSHPGVHTLALNVSDACLDPRSCVCSLLHIPGLPDSIIVPLSDDAI